jgi:VWFA-related protein
VSSSMWTGAPPPKRSRGVIEPTVMKTLRLFALAGFVAAAWASVSGQQQNEEQAFRFRTGVELINVTATVTDRSGRFVSGLGQQDFRVFEDGVEQPITHFDSERVPVSLGIALDTSGSMEGEKMAAAREALNRFLFDLLDPSDEVFLYRFASAPELVEGWTVDRERLRAELRRIRPNGGTALYDTVVEAVPLTQTGRHRKKALVIISDGNDTNSQTDIGDVKGVIRDSEVLVYAIGVDGDARIFRGRQPGGVGPPGAPPRFPFPLPFPIPGRRPPRTPTPIPGGGGVVRIDGDRVNAAALRAITDDSGGRTEIVSSPSDLDPATAGIADELSKQYYLGYPSTGKKDGRWHTIRVEVRKSSYQVRARRGYVAS